MDIHCPVFNPLPNPPNQMINIELTPEQYDLIRIAIEYWAQDQYMLEEDNETEEDWEEQKEILNDPNFPW